MTKSDSTRLDQQLARLKTSTTQIGSLVSEQFGRALLGVEHSSTKLAYSVIAQHYLIDELARAVDDQAMQIIADRRATGSELREVMLAIQVSSKLKYVGHLARGIARRTHNAPLAIAPGPMKGVRRLGAIALGQLNSAVNAYAGYDGEEAAEVWRGQEHLQATYPAVTRELLASSMADPRMIGVSARLICIADDIERIGEICLNSAECIYRFVYGRPLAEDGARGELSHLRSIRLDGARESSQETARKP
jgi:phosphate transport system protein